ncbi:MAG: IS256 family transposase [Deltaproteobacteria bacterium]|nr:MAG: IS256 family transposase [Deltaproteobacteria bacterium]
MRHDNVHPLQSHQASSNALVDDPLTELLRRGARKLIEEAIHAELDVMLESVAHLKDEQGRRRVVRNGYLPERSVQTGIGEVTVKVPRVRDRAKTAQQKIRFTSSILPKYMRKTRSLEALIPWLYLKGVSTGDFSEALAALLGTDAPGLSQPTISRLKAAWKQEYEAWRQRDLSQKEYVYVWADGVYFNVRMDQDAQCILVIIGATKDGRKELIAIEDGYRESAQSWRELLLDLKRRGLTVAPKLAVGDGSLGFWSALHEVYSTTRQQRCWVHKTANVLNNLPKSQQPKAKQRLHNIYLAETREAAEEAFDFFIEAYQAKYPKAADCLVKDRDALLTFYDFPAEHWRHLRTTNPIESTFATVRLRTAKVRGCFSRETVLTMVFRLGLCAEKTWRRLNGSPLLVDVLAGIRYIDGIHPDRIAA